MSHLRRIPKADHCDLSPSGIDVKVADDVLDRSDVVRPEVVVVHVGCRAQNERDIGLFAACRRILFVCIHCAPQTFVNIHYLTLNRHAINCSITYETC